MRVEEKLLYANSRPGTCGVDLEDVTNFKNTTGLPARENIDLPEVSEPDVIRHFVRLSQMNYSIDSNFYPLGSCTMKHNPRLNEKIARLPGFAQIHPLQPTSTCQGALELIYDLQEWLKDLTGLPGVTLAPAAGAHGELTGMMMIKKAHEEKGNPRKVVLVPDSAHGTNPATAATCGYTTVTIPSANGLVNMAEFEKAIKTHGEDIAAFMLTNPNTCGLFEPNVIKISKRLREIGAYFYCDGANFNAIVGKVKPGDLGVDVMQLNLHKTFSTPHGGGGPGCGPLVVSEKLMAYLPVPKVVQNNNEYALVTTDPASIGRIKAFHGHFGMMVRALSYMKSHGINGLQKVAEDAVLNANYVLTALRGPYRAPYNDEHTPCMHECLLNDREQKDNGISTMDIAKGLLDRGFHPMTVYFPLVTQGAMLIEPTETENKTTLDKFITAMLDIAKQAKANPADLHKAPVTTPRKRLDEVQAAKFPVLTWQDEQTKHPPQKQKESA